MRFTHFTVAAVGLAGIVPSVLATITITSPSADSYWVQNASKVITWTSSANDPTPVTIVVTNTNTTVLNGHFPIEENVDVSKKSTTLTNVTLLVRDGYIVNFVNPKNLTQIYAQSGQFAVKSPGTPQAPSAPSGTGTSPAGNATASGAATGPKNSTSTSASPHSFDRSLMTLAPMVGMSVLVSAVSALGRL